MPSPNLVQFLWPDLGNTVSIVALVLALAVFVFGIFSGVRVNKVRVSFAVTLAAVLGWLIMPFALYAAAAVHLMDWKYGTMVVMSLMMLFVAMLATHIYEIITVSLSDMGMAAKK